MLHKIGIGTVQFGLSYGINNQSGKTSSNEVREILEFARLNEIRFIDTASAYGDSEKTLGKIGVNGFNVITKFLPGCDTKNSISIIEQSFNSLHLSKLYGIMFHRPNQVLSDKEIWPFLNDLKKQEKVTKIGFSFNEVTEAEKVLETGVIPDIVQIPYNYFDDRFERIARELKKMKCEVHVRSVFLQGLFFMKPELLSQFFNPLKNALKELQSSTANLSGSLLNYVLKKEFVDCAIIGINNLNQLKHNVSSLLCADDLTNPAITFSDELITPSLWPKK